MGTRGLQLGFDFFDCSGGIHPALRFMTRKKSSWFVYMVKCRDGSIYTGISNDVEDRIKAHNSGEGAKYTSSRQPVHLIFQEEHPDKSSAFKREIRIKRWSKERKEALSNSGIGD